MKKTLFIAAFAAVLVFAFAASAFAYGPLYSGGYNPGYPPQAASIGSEFSGYLSWSYVKAQTSAIDSPHGNYTTTTNKCAVCHAVHRADPDGVVLTAWGGVGETKDPFTGQNFGSVMKPFESCFFCHGNGATFTNKVVEFAVAKDGTLSPHTTCGRCHTASPHGAGGSAYPLLASKLLNTKADPTLAYDLAGDGTDSYNDLDAAMFDLSDETLKAQGITLGTGYLCVGCHGNASNEHVFAVNARGATPALHYTANGKDVAGNVTGHEVWVAASDDWSNPGAWYSGGGPHDYYLAIYVYDGVEYKVASATTFTRVSDGEVVDAADIPAWDSTIAYNSALGCGACHDATRADGKLAFPHGYVKADGTPAPKRSTLVTFGARPGPGVIGFDDITAEDPTGYTIDSSFLWMTVADRADVEDRALMLDTGNFNISANPDGACLKCHVSNDNLEGVGKTY